jgi:hypothetical protein
MKAGEDSGGVMKAQPRSCSVAPGESCVSLLKERLEAIEAGMIELIDCSTVTTWRDDPSSEVVFIGFPRHYWGEPDDRQRRLQIKLKGMYTDWSEQMHLLFSGAPDDLQKEITEADDFVRKWIEKESSHDIVPDPEENKRTFRKKTAVFRDVLTTLDDPKGSRVTLVPDTNSFVWCPDPGRYGEIAGRDRYDFVLLPTVLSELDGLAMKTRDDAFRDKVKAAIRRYKGWREQGRLVDGVTVNRTITVRSVAREPNFDKTLHWLDRTIRDDRIVASVLELQRAIPSAVIVLVTSDVNLQNKADAAGIPCAESPSR